MIALAWVKARRSRDRIFDADLFSDPAWDILLDLYVSHCRRRPVSIMDLCLVAAVPNTTALRWIGLLESRGLIQRHPDRTDRRRWNMCLTRKGIDDMELALERAAESDRKMGLGRLDVLD